MIVSIFVPNSAVLICESAILNSGGVYWLWSSNPEPGHLGQQLSKQQTRCNIKNMTFLAMNICLFLFLYFDKLDWNIALHFYRNCRNLHVDLFCRVILNTFWVWKLCINLLYHNSYQLLVTVKPDCPGSGVLRMWWQSPTHSDSVFRAFSFIKKIVINFVVKTPFFTTQKLKFW